MKFKNMLFPMIVCPAWIPELNSIEHGPEGKGRFTPSSWRGYEAGDRLHDG